MDDIVQILGMWQNEMILVLLMLAGLAVGHSLTKRMGAPGSSVFTAILLINLVVVSLMLHSMRFFWHLHISNRAIIFLALYAWCVCAMLFFAAHRTHCVKLCLALASQAGILYGLFIWL